MYVKQTLAILDKNYTIMFRNKKQLLKELLFPIVTSLFIIYSKSSGKDTKEFLLAILPIYLPSSIIGLTRRLLINFVNEKKEKYKETQKIMGCSSISYLSGWFLTLYSEALFISILTLGAIMYVNPSISYLTLCSLYLTYVIAVTHQTFFLTTFFNSPKLAGELGSFIQSIGVFFYYYLQSHQSKFAGIVACLMPQPCLSLALMPYLIEKSNLLQMNSENLKYYEGIAGYMLVFDCVLYLLLFLWFDQIFPNEYGIRKPVFFFVNDILRYFGLKSDPVITNRTGFQQFSDENNNIELQSQNPQQEEFKIRNGNDSDWSSAKYHQPYDFVANNKSLSIQIEELQKWFKSSEKTVKAVNNMSLQLYNKSIFCLLGHNGSGKTTTINLLTGMIAKDHGFIRYFGKNLEDSIEEVRKMVGLCGQTDVLYDEMTVTEHLRFYGNLKGKSGQELQQEISDLIPKICLQNEYQKQAQHLSGGNKRKLCLGIALIGDSKIILLDEPTSGMDTVARRQLWDILETIKQENRTIILTTHYLEEAEALADRIGIMNQGQLQIVGTSDFIKKKYGVGYHMYLTPKYGKDEEFQEQKTKLCEIVSNHVTQSTIDTHTLENQLKFTLPFSQQKEFIGMFEEIEKFDFVIINLEMNTLEETFVNMALQQEDEDSSINEERLKIQNIDILKHHPDVKLCNQIRAMAARQYRLILRNWEVWIMIILPILMIFCGVYVCKVLYEELQKEIKKSGIDKNEEFKKQADEIKNITLSIFAQLAGFFIVYVKHLLNVMGTHTIRLSYWIGTFVSDYICFLVPFGAFIASIYIFDVEFLEIFIFRMSLIISVFGMSLLSYSYLMSFFYTKSNSAFKQFPLINLFLNFTLWFILRGIFQSNVVAAYLIEILMYIFSPFMCLQRGFSYIQDADKEVLLGDFYGDDDDDNKSGSDSSLRFLAEARRQHGRRRRHHGAQDDEDMEFSKYVLIQNFYGYLLILIMQIILYGIAIYFLDKKQRKVKSDKVTPQQQNVVNMLQQYEQLEESVKNEQLRVQDQLNQDDSIMSSQIHKVYENNFHAVKGISFGVKKGEIFGLLGPNGAGKSTTFNMLSSKITRTTGEILINGQPINDGSGYTNNLGLCPQKDCIWDNLTPKEHLVLYGRIKGLQGDQLKRAVQTYLDFLELNPHAGNKAANLSGGNKRRLSVAIAMIGAPKIGFFDEPSSGLDPIAKRCLWNLLSQSNKENNSSILLTTHSMPEAESLCGRIGILINGQFQCLDSLQNLKNRYGKGIYLSVVEVQEHQMYTKEKIEGVLQQFQKIGKEDSLHYLIPFNNFCFHQVFKLLQDLKDDQKIIDFSITQSSLEQIFIQFSSQQINFGDHQQ